MNTEIIETKLKEMTEKIVAEFKPEKIILFGSRAWGVPGPDSDVDVLVVKETDRSTREVAREIDGAIFPRPFPLDLLVYRPDQVEEGQARGDFFIKNILTKGRILYAK